MPTTVKAAIKKWEEATGKKAAEAKEIKLIGVYPPIGNTHFPLEMDHSVCSLVPKGFVE